MAKEISNHEKREKHERHENKGIIQNHECTQMDTNYQKSNLTTKSTKSTKIMGKFRTTNDHEWTRMEKEEFNHERHERHEKEEGRVRTTNDHEWTRMEKGISNHEKHERHEKEEGRVRTTKGTKASGQSLVGSKKTQLLEGRGGKDSRVLGYQCSIIIAIKGLCDCFFLVKLLFIYS